MKGELILLLNTKNIRSNTNNQVEKFLRTAEESLRWFEGCWGVAEIDSTYYAEQMRTLLEQIRKDFGKCHPEEAVRCILYILKVTGTIDIDDGYGDVYESEKEYIDYIREMLSENLGRGFKDSVFKMLLSEIDGAIIDYQEDLLIDLLYDNFSETEYKNLLLAFTDARIREAAITGSYKRRVFTRKCAPLWLENGMPARDVVERLIFDGTAIACDMCLKIMDKTNDIELTYCVLNRYFPYITQTDRYGNRYVDMLKECESTVPEKYKDFFSFCRKPITAEDDYKRWKKLFSVDIWPILECIWYEAADDKKRLARWSTNGRLIEKAFCRGRWNYISIKEADNFVPILKDTYPYELLHLYYNAFENEALHATTRKQYRKLAYSVKKLEDLEGGSVAVPLIVRNVMKVRLSSHAFAEEMADAFPEIVG